MEPCYRNIVDAVLGSPWAILPQKLDAIVDFLRMKSAGLQVNVSEEYIKAAAERGRTLSRINGKVAVLQVYGVLCQRMNLMGEFSGGTSYEQLGAAFDSAMANKDVGCIVLDCDSPGGSVGGCLELATKIFKARGEKPIISIANSLAASAMYFVAAAADEVICTPGGMVGSIGVIMAHTDFSKMNEALGVKNTYITAGKYKAEGNEDEPLDTDARAYLQSVVDDYYDQFTDAVAQYRGTTQLKVKKNYGEGRMFTAAKAVEAGLCDRVATFEKIIGELGGNVAKARVRAEGEPPEVTAEKQHDMDLERRRWRQIQRGAENG